MPAASHSIDMNELSALAVQGAVNMKRFWIRGYAAEETRGSGNSQGMVENAASSSNNNNQVVHQTQIPPVPQQQQQQPQPQPQPLSQPQPQPSTGAPATSVNLF